MNKPVSQRMHEIGLRMALGARLAQVQWMVVRAALKSVPACLALGALISLWSPRLISGLLFGCITATGQCSPWSLSSCSR